MAPLAASPLDAPEPIAAIGRLLRAPVLAVALTLGACTGFELAVPEPPPPSPDPAVRAAAFPDLADVPPRPRLSYDLTQRRQILAELASDRDNARYSGESLRHAVGLRASEPELPIPLPDGDPVPVPDPEALAELERQRRLQADRALAIDYVEDAMERESDDGSLDDFLEELLREQPPPEDGPVEEANRFATATAPPVTAPAPPSPPEDGSKGDGPPGDGPWSLAFAPLSSDLPPAAFALARALEGSSSDLRIVSAGDGPALREARGERLATLFERRGVAASRITLESGGAGDTVVVYRGDTAR